MFCELFTQLPGIVFLAKEKQNIIGVMRMKSCEGYKPIDNPKDSKDENREASKKHSELSRHSLIANVGATYSDADCTVGQETSVRH